MGLCVVAVALAAAAPVVAAPASPPRVYAQSICTTAAPFAQKGFVSGLAPNTRYAVRATFSTGGVATTGFTTDASGNAAFGEVFQTQPFEVTVVIWLDPNDNLTQDPGEPTVVTATLRAERPCEDAVAVEQRPTSKDQCKNGGWRNYPGFKNQGDCVSFVATGGKTPPGG
jgi:hypothetical protein